MLLQALQGVSTGIDKLEWEQRNDLPFVVAATVAVVAGIVVVAGGIVVAAWLDLLVVFVTGVFVAPMHFGRRAVGIVVVGWSLV